LPRIKEVRAPEDLDRLVKYIMNAVTYGPAYQSVDILCCRARNDYESEYIKGYIIKALTPYEVVVHELAHVWSNNKNISRNDDIKELYTKYKAKYQNDYDEELRICTTCSGGTDVDDFLFSNGKILFNRLSTYENEEEFFAYAFSWYYLKYIDPTDIYKDYDYPEDIKKVMDKYVCLAKNIYDEGKC
jgi:hypothetical protein